MRNGRTARLLMNLVLMQNGYPVVAIPPVCRVRYMETAAVGNRGGGTVFAHLLAEFCQQTRLDYIRMLQKLQS